MKLIFLGYGLAWIAVVGAFVSGRDRAWVAMLIAAVRSLWYLPFGMPLGIIQIAHLPTPAVGNPAA